VKHFDYDVLVIGGGHAGSDAALAAARMGARTALITHRKDRIGEMSCNPAIGGLGKGHTVTVLETEARDLLLDGRRVIGVETGNGPIHAGAVILTTGTFLNGLMHIGNERSEGGRVGDPPSKAMAKRLYALGLPMGRLKTGTPARLDGRTIDYTQLEEQAGDEVPAPFSFLTDRITTPQIPCHITRTTAAAHQIIEENLDKSALYGGQIEGVGPRYCPSIEDKIVRMIPPFTPMVFQHRCQLMFNVHS